MEKKKGKKKKKKKEKEIPLFVKRVLLSYDS